MPTQEEPLQGCTLPGALSKTPMAEPRGRREGSRELGGVAVDIKSKVWDSEVTGQGLWRTPAVIVLSSHGSLLASFHPRSLQGPKWRSVEEEFPHIYAHGCVLKDVCSDCTSFVADVVCSSRKSVDVLNATPRRSRQTQSLYIPNTRTLNFQ